MDTPTVARAVTTIHAPTPAVWNALVDPALIKQYMFGTTVTSDWTEGSPIAWKGEWQGNRTKTKAVILRIHPDRLLKITPLQPTVRAAGHSGQLPHRNGRAGR